MNATNQYQDCFINVKKDFILSSYLCDPYGDRALHSNLIIQIFEIFSIYFLFSLDMGSN